MIDHYTNKMQNVIQMELFKAQKSIKIAMAWFTYDLLFHPLLLKLQMGEEDDEDNFDCLIINTLNP